MAKRKWSFVREGATKQEGGAYKGKRMGGLFRIWYVTGGDGTKFQRSPYSATGWKVQKNRTTYNDEHVLYDVKNEDDVAALEKFVDIPLPYRGYGAYS